MAPGEHSTPTVDDLRQHVFHDAVDLAGCTGMLEPLANLNLNGSPGLEAAEWLRRQLVTILVLTVLRMHECPQLRPGRTGTTASIPTLLTAAVRDGRLSCEIAEGLHSKLRLLRVNYEPEGGSFDELRDFRHAELAHSLHRHVPAQSLMLLPVWALAHDTFELVIALERGLDQTGKEAARLGYKFHQWRDRGNAFWKSVGLTDG